MHRFYLLIIPVILCSCYAGEELQPDQQIWEYKLPNTVGLDETTLLNIDTAIVNNFYQRISGLIIIKDDKMVFENYYDSTDRHSIIALDEATLGFTIAAIGIAIDQGLLNLEDPISMHLPEYVSIFNDNTNNKQDVQINHLLTHRSGFAWNENILPASDADNNLNQMFASSDWIGFILNQPLEADPGVRYNFNSGTGTILAKLVENASGQPFDQFLQENLLSTIGVTTFSIAQDPTGNFDGGRGASISFLDWTKFGYLMLQEGIWNERRIIDPNFVEEATSLQTSVSPNFNLGYGWGIFGDNFDNFLPISKDGIYYLNGDIGQHIYILPSQNMVVVINASNFFFGFNNPSLNLFIQITAAIL